MAVQQQATFVPRSQIVPVENLSAGADIADRVVWVTPCKVRIVSAIMYGPASSGVDGSNTLVVAVKVGSTTLFTVTRTGNLSADTQYALTESNVTEIAAGTSVLLSVTQGAAADIAGLSVQLNWTTDGLIPA